MAKQKTLNKNLVAFLTVGGMLLAVLVVVVGVLSAAQRDPEEFVRRAVAQEERGDLEGAVSNYVKAYRVDKDVARLVEAARCFYQMGEIGESLRVLMTAHAQDPADIPVLEALLTRYWELRNLGIDWNQLRDYADKLLALDPAHRFALVARSAALDSMKNADPKFAEAAAEALQRAVASDPTDPRVTEVRVQARLTQAQAEARKLVRERRTTDANDLLAAARVDCVDLLEKSLAAHADDVELITAATTLLMDMNEFARAEQLVAQALLRQPKRFELQLAQSTVLLRQAELIKDAQGAELERGKHLCESGLAAIEQAVAIEPAAYQAYRLKSAALRLKAQLDERWTSDPVAARREVLDMLTTALARTVGLKSLVARLGGGMRAQTMTTAFDLAVDYHREAKDDETRALFLNYAKQFMDSARTELGANVVVPLMEGQYAALTGDMRAAIQAYASAEQRVEGTGTNFERLAQEQLAILYSRAGESGTSLRYVERVFQWYQAAGLTAPLEFQLLRCELLIQMSRSEESLLALDQLAEQAPDDTRVAQLRAQALTDLDRPEEAAAAIKNVEFKDPIAAKLLQASVAVSGGKHDEAQQLLEAVLDEQPQRPGAVTMYASLMNNAGRQARATEYLNQLAARDLTPDIKRTIQAHLILVNTADPAERDAKLLELIGTIEDPIARAQEQYTFHVSRRNWDEAAKSLDALEQLRPEEPAVLEWQFDLALQREQLPRAAEYETKLTKINADRAGGALFRGRRFLAAGDCDNALAEFRAAERELQTDPSVKVWVAQSLLCLNETEQAITLLKRVLESDPLNFGVNRMLYTILEELDRSDEAAPHLEAAAKANPNDPYIKEKTRLLEERRNPAQGIVWREEQRTKDPADISNLLALVRLYRDPRSADPAKAEELVEDALRRAPADIRVAQRARRVYADTGQRQKAEAALQKHLDASAPGDRCRAQLEFADLYDALGDDDAAEKQFELARQEALTLAADAADVSRAQQLEVIRRRIRFLDRRGRLDDVIAGYKAALEIIPPEQKNDVAVSRLGILSALLRKRDIPETEKQIAEFRQLFPDDQRILLAEAQHAMMAGQLERARDLFTKVLEGQPDNPWALFHRGRMQMFLRKFKEAGEDLLRSKELAPTAFEYQHRMELARLYTMQEAYELAESELQELLTIMPDNDQIALTLQRLYRGTGQEQKAEQFTARMIARKPENPFWHHQFGQLMTSRGSSSAALSSFEKAVQLSQSRNPEYLADWLAALIAASRFEDAVAVGAGLPLEMQGYAGVVARLAEAELRAGKPDDARARLRTAIRNAGAIQLDLVYFLVGQYARLINRDEAVQTLRQLIDDPETKELAQLSLKCALIRQLIDAGGTNGSPEAMQLARSVLERAPADSIFQIEARVLPALEATLRGDGPAALTAYREVLGKFPDHVPSLNNLAFLMADRLDQATEAVEYAERAFNLTPENPNVLDTLAWTYFKAGRKAEAESMMLQALSRDPESLAILIHLARFHEAERQTGEARRYYQRVRDSAARTGAGESEYAREAAEALQRLGT